MFRLASAPTKESYFGSMTEPDPGLLAEDELRASLDQALARAVLKALADPQWDWRTAEGVAHEVGLSEDLVIRIIESLPEKIIRSRTPDRTGRALYATRSHYKERRGFLDSFRST
jgi:hypothetical protein